ncbi:hypothetical protein C2S52_018708 [Perilla frutescens var. hirtella]|nr:hypothetical protein C2S52_018708 [Perilla frutescens var. hirtella]
MADAAAVIPSAIEKLDSWLLQKADLRDNDHAKLCSLQLEKKDLVVGMAELWENNKEMLYSLLVRLADPWDVKEEKVHNDNLYSFLVEMEDLWEINCREKLHSLLVEMVDPNIRMEKLYSMAVETADLWRDSKGKLNKEKLYSWLAKKVGHWRDSKGKLNKEKLYSWLANKAGLWEEDKLFRLLKDMTVPGGPNHRMELLADDWKYVEEVKNDMRLILDKLEDEGSSHDHLHYFISDVVEMAHDVQLLVHVKDSDPFVLFLQIFNPYVIGSRARKEHTMSSSDSYIKFFRMIVFIQRGIKETKERMLEFGAVSQINCGGEELVYSDAVGLEKDVELLLRNAETTISIQGLGGIGKTTLARVFYNHPEIVNGFECRAWVCLSSRGLSRKELLIKLIRQLIDSKSDDILIEKMENKALKQMIHQHLQDKRSVIILDDVSEETYLQYVFQALPRDKRSRLLFTTRSPDIRCNPYKDFEHKMKNLDDNKSWQLLLKTALRDEEFPKKLEKKGRQMLMRKCGGLPLAIKEVGKQWAKMRQSGREWEQVVESTMDMDLSATLVALESAYLNLDPHLKLCFLQLAFFKEGTIIRANKLVQIWTAGGLEKHQSLLGFTKLTRHFIIEALDKNKTNDSTKTFRINVVFHRLSITKAEHEIGFEILRKDENIRDYHEPRHHRVIHCSRDKFNLDYSSMNHDKHLVSLFFHGGDGHSDVCRPSYWKHFEQLKILDMEGFGLKILPETIGDLTELRYLGLRSNYIEELPQSLGRLKMLEVLDIAQNFMVQVSDVLWEMDRLRHLYMSDIICRKPLKIEALKNLETLTYISVDSWTYEVSGLKMMTSLRRLGIEEVDRNSNVSKLFASLAKLENLECLFLRGFRFRSMPSLEKLHSLRNLTELKLEGRLTSLPNANNFPPKLWLLVLVNSCLDEDPMPIIDKLRELRYLKLQNAYTGHQMVISHDGLPKLRNLVILDFWHLRNVQIRRKSGIYSWDDLQVEINSCPNLETIGERIVGEKLIRWRLKRRRPQRTIYKNRQQLFTIFY